MRGRRFVLAFLVVALLSAGALLAAEVVVLKDGRSIPLAKPYVVKGKVAILTLPDKTMLSVPVAEIDKAKTAEARAHAAAPAPVPTPIGRPLTPAEAAKTKSARKATVSMSDDTIAHPAGIGGDAGKAGAPGGEGHVELGSVSVTRGEKGSYSITGTLTNTGKADVAAVQMTIEAIGGENQTLTSGFASIAKDSLSPGEKTTFVAELQTEAAVSSFNYVPRWKEKTPSKMSVASGTVSGGGGSTPSAAPTPSPEEVRPVTDRSAEERQPRPSPIPRGDVAAPPSNAPVGQPSEPGGAYLPQPSSEGQPKAPTP